MWSKDFPEQDPDSNYPEPTATQLLHEQEARRHLASLTNELEQLTVPQQRAIIGELSGSVFKKEKVAGDERLVAYPAHESEGQALTEASQTDE